jgi:hypothetical protein
MTTEGIYALRTGVLPIPEGLLATSLTTGWDDLDAHTKAVSLAFFLPHELVCSTYYIQDYKQKEKDTKQKVSVLCYELLPIC